MSHTYLPLFDYLCFTKICFFVAKTKLVNENKTSQTQFFLSVFCRFISNLIVPPGLNNYLLSLFCGGADTHAHRRTSVSSSPRPITFPLFGAFFLQFFLFPTHYHDPLHDPEIIFFVLLFCGGRTQADLIAGFIEFLPPAAQAEARKQWEVAQAKVWLCALCVQMRESSQYYLDTNQ